MNELKELTKKEIVDYYISSPDFDIEVVASLLAKHEQGLCKVYSDGNGRLEICDQSHEGDIEKLKFAICKWKHEDHIRELKGNLKAEKIQKESEERKREKIKKDEEREQLRAKLRSVRKLARENHFRKPIVKRTHVICPSCDSRITQREKLIDDKAIYKCSECGYQYCDNDRYCLSFGEFCTRVLSNYCPHPLARNKPPPDESKPFVIKMGRRAK